ncbi:MAG: SMP-30/gluconolactonase/LRE family protein [Chitinophagaceae bacterium]|nr:SMP-30/gluconolactonase/LRE family protein [Chitinophagaceae bacterium]
MSLEKHNGCIYKFNPQGIGEVWHEGPFSFANGMSLSADQQRLYVVSTWLPGVEAIDINADGSAGKRYTIVELPKTCPDGIALDEEGNIYVSCYAPNVIYKIDTGGELHTLIDDWESHTVCNPTNIAFGGADHKDLFIANLGRWHIAKLRLESRGLKLIGQS